MSRLESIAKAGYFPTPPEVVTRIAGLLNKATLGGRRTVRLIDPCCGTGAALGQLADLVGGETYGIEIAADRFEEARSTLDHTLHASGLTARVAGEAFSAMLLNPPYDHDDDSKRLEHTFLVETSRVLCKGGLLVFIVPQRRLELSARYLAGHFRNLSCYRFPDGEFEAFRQVVVLGERRDVAANDIATRDQIMAWSQADDLPTLPVLGEANGRSYVLADVPANPVLFSALFFDPRAAAAEAKRYGQWTNPALSERLWPAEERPVRPLMPLRRGHLAMLIAAGFLNNLLLESDGRRLLVKGRTYKEAVEVASDDPDVRVEREVLRTSVVTLDLRAAAFEVVQQAGAARPANPPRAA